MSPALAAIEVELLAALAKAGEALLAANPYGQPAEESDDE